ncbi:hypothetical protein [Nocardia sp. AB354]|uniref:hypothetical protein n=1 Tax=Nocardia sp. AB354 TaxID=3413283 RepID=UPI003C2159A0
MDISAYDASEILRDLCNQRKIRRLKAGTYTRITNGGNRRRQREKPPDRRQQPTAAPRYSKSAARYRQLRNDAHVMIDLDIPDVAAAKVMAGQLTDFIAEVQQLAMQFGSRWKPLHEQARATVNRLEKATKERELRPPDATRHRLEKVINANRAAAPRPPRLWVRIVTGGQPTLGRR